MLPASNHSQGYRNTHFYQVTSISDQYFFCYCVDSHTHTLTHGWMDRTKNNTLLRHFTGIREKQNDDTLPIQHWATLQSSTWVSKSKFLVDKHWKLLQQPNFAAENFRKFGRLKLTWYLIRRNFTAVWQTQTHRTCLKIMLHAAGKTHQQTEINYNAKVEYISFKTYQNNK